jgi:hypothetical protein
MDAVDQLGFRVTVGDVASNSGLSVTQSRQELLGLAQDAGGVLQVSEQGDIAYVFSHEYRRELERRAQKSRSEAFKRKLWSAFLYGLRISFGLILIVSIVLALLVIALLMAASSGDREGRERSGGPLVIPNLWLGNPFFSPFYDPYSGGGYGRRQRGRAMQKRSDAAELNFLEAVYSFLFGDGNPNADLEARRDRAIANLIAANGGAIAGEQVLPYLDHPVEGQLPEYEDYMLPALVKFDGRPEVSDRGEIVYRFPELQIAATDRQQRNVPAFLKEQTWSFSRATSGQATLISILGAANFILWAGLQVYGGQVATILGIPVGLVGFVFGILLLYGTLFLAVPGIRWFALQRRNQQVEARNGDRNRWRKWLEQPSDSLREKIAFARRFAGREVFGEEETIYTTEKDLIDQRDYELDRPEFKALKDKD